jgi:CubicO group peptidase (beta-lactamase class C family)
LDVSPAKSALLQLKYVSMKTTDPETVGFSTQRLSRIDNLMNRYVDSGKLAGAVTCLARRGHVVHFGKFGYQDIESKTPMEVDTIFRIYSMTKPVTSVALMMLFERGLVRLEDHVTRFIPDFKKLKVLSRERKLVDLVREITVHDLLTHTAGLSYGEYEDGLLDNVVEWDELYQAEIALAEFIRRLAKLPLIGQPGERFHYSSATDVVGFLVELIAEVNLAQFFEQEIFEPLGMVDTGFMVPVEKADRLATLYEAKGEGNLDEAGAGPDSDYSERTRLYAGGHGLASTAADYRRFAQMLLNYGELDGVRLLGRKTMELMTMNHLPPALLPLHYNGVVDQPAPGIGFGLGFNVIVDVARSGTMGSAGDYGWGGNAETYFWVSPQERLVAILMTQCMPSLTYPIRNEFRTLVYQALVD